MTTLAPSAARRSAAALPMPCEPPVTRATLPFNSRSINLLLSNAGAYPRSSCVFSTVDRAAGAGLVHHHLREQGQRRLEPRPDPARQLFAGRVLQPGHVVQ